MRFFIIIILLGLLISCGNRKPNILEEGEIDISDFPFPPNPDFKYPKEQEL